VVLSRLKVAQARKLLKRLKMIKSRILVENNLERQPERTVLVKRNLRKSINPQKRALGQREGELALSRKTAPEVRQQLKLLKQKGN